MMFFFICIVYFHNVEGRREKKNTYDIEERLRTELLANYSAQQKPRSNLKIFVGLTILTVKELVRYHTFSKSHGTDIKGTSQIISLSVGLRD